MELDDIDNPIVIINLQNAALKSAISFGPCDYSDILIILCTVMHSFLILMEQPIVQDLFKNLSNK